MIEKIIVVAPTTAVPMSTGLAVALNVLPAPSFSSRQVLGTLEIDVEPVVLLDFLLDVGDRLDHRQLVDRLRVVGDRAVGVDRNRHRSHAEEAERHETEREHRRRDHQSAEPLKAHQVGDRHQDDDGEPEPVGAEVAGDEARQDVERGGRPRATR
jgi:hypothetical protein